LVPPQRVVFLTLFLGLVAGPWTVQLRVDGEPAAVELLLDGRTTARLLAPPWQAQVDFGELLPHELVAISYAPDGSELGRAQQWLNLPRSPVETQIVLERDAMGAMVGARLLWQGLTAEAPTEATLLLDGKPLSLRADEQPFSLAANLPPLDFGAPHLLAGELQFANGVGARRDLAFGGDLGAEAQTQLTAVALRRQPGTKLPPTAALASWLRGPAGPLLPLAVESGTAEVWLVRDLSAREAAAKYGARRGGPSRHGLATFGGGGLPPQVQGREDALRFEARLRSSARLSFLWPISRVGQSGPLVSNLFDGSRTFLSKDVGLAWLLANVEHPLERQQQSFADAVAVAGLQAVAGGRPRVVVLVLGEETRAEVSLYRPDAIRAYLSALRVPLRVWSLAGAETPAALAWGGATDVSSLTKLRRAVRELSDDLESQLVVWVEGAYLPQQIQLTDAALAAGARAAGERGVPGPVVGPIR
jgi:hypothetical protein